MVKRRMAKGGRAALLLLAILFALAASGCGSARQDAAQVQRSDFLWLGPGRPVGQTFFSRYAGLNGVALVLKPDAELAAGPAEEATILLSLRKNPGDEAVLRQASLPLSQVQADAYYTFTFPELADSSHQDYYLELDVQGAGQVWVGSGSADSYLNGAAYLAGQALPAQLTFNLLHGWQSLALGLLQEGLGWLGILLAAAFLFVPPGAALLKAFWPAWPTHWWIEKLALSVGVSLAVYPILLLWTKLVGLHLGALYAWLPPLAGLAWLAWDGRRGLAHFWSQARQLGFWRARLSLYFAHPAGWLPEALVIVLLGLGLGCRFWAIRTLDFPMWGDAYQHTMMAQLIVDNGGLFDSWQPYAEMSSFTYHYGFHTAVALLHWITGLELRLAILWMGQIMNGLAALVLIPLALRLQPSRWTAVAMAGLVGLALPTPMIYTGWGRYTQLSGQLIMPAAIYLAWDTLESSGPAQGRIRQNLLNWITLCGLALTHYRVAVFGAMFFPAYFLVNGFAGSFRQSLRRIFWLGIGAAVLFLPWLWHLFSGYLMRIAYDFTRVPVAQFTPEQAGSLLTQTLTYAPLGFWLAGLASIMWGMWLHERRLLVVVTWWLLNLLAANPQWLQLGGQGIVDNFTLMIAAYIPISLAAAPSAGWLTQYLGDCLAPRRLPAVWIQRAARAGLAAALVLGGAAYARQRSLDIKPTAGMLATRADLRAAAWIQHNLPPETVFLVNSFSAYAGSSVVGSDGGWWLPLLTGRRTTLPPLTYVSEQGPRPEYRLWVNQLTETIAKEGVLGPAVRNLLARREVSYVYLGQRQGSVNNPSGGLDPQLLLSSPNFQLVYHQDQVYIFAFKP